MQESFASTTLLYASTTKILYIIYFIYYIYFGYLDTATISYKHILS